MAFKFCFVKEAHDSLNAIHKEILLKRGIYYLTKGNIKIWLTANRKDEYNVL